MKKGRILRQFIIGAFIISIILTATWLVWALNSVPKKGENPTENKTVSFLEITPNFFLFRAYINNSSVSFTFGFMYYILPIIGGILNILLYNYSENKKITEERIIDETN